jgi:hypothetical protein
VPAVGVAVTIIIMVGVAIIMVVEGPLIFGNARA